MVEAKEGKSSVDVPGSSQGGSTGASYTVSAVDRALQLLLALAEMPDSGVTELADRTGSTKSLTFRLLYTLEQRGFVAKDPARRTYTLGYSTLMLGDQSRRQSRLIAAAEPFLNELADISRENVLLMVREDLHSLCVSLKMSPQPLRIFAEVGRKVALHVGGGPKVLLAFAPPEVQAQVVDGPLSSFTPVTVTNRDALRARLELIRQRGYEISVGELDASTYSIAAPLRDHSGEVVAAISVNGPTARLDAATHESTLAALLSVSARLSAQLGWRGPASAQV